MACRLHGWSIALALLATGCGLFRSSPPPPAPPAPEPVALPLEVEITATDHLNPDERGRPLPTLVRLYQLKSVGKVERAEYDPLYRQPKETLGEDLLQAEELTLSPGETVKRRVERDKAARALAVVAVFRRPNGLSWRVVTELAPVGQRTDFRFLVDGYRVERR